MTSDVSPQEKIYWNKLKSITFLLLSIWFLITFVASFFAKELSFEFFGWSFSFWLGAQGALFVYLIIVWYYARYVNMLEDNLEKNSKNE